MVLVYAEVSLAHLVEARGDHLVDNDDLFRAADVDARAEGGDSGIGAAVWLRQIVRRELYESIDLHSDSQLHRSCGIVTVSTWAKIRVGTTA